MSAVKGSNAPFCTSCGWKGFPGDGCRGTCIEAREKADLKCYIDPNTTQRVNASKIDSDDKWAKSVKKMYNKYIYRLMGEVLSESYTDRNINVIRSPAVTVSVRSLEKIQVNGKEQIPLGPNTDCCVVQVQV
jgi:hypothetical protein